ncbi:MAG: choice-of-anchor tandem repeat GloVer-containing protein [Terriglobales bacterium]
MYLAGTNRREKCCLNILAVGPKLGATKLATATRGALTLVVLSVLLLLALQPAHAQTETVLHIFGGGKSDGGNPEAGLVMDNLGNLYGTTYYGGAYGGGTAFELTPAGTETVLYSFGGGKTAGFNPTASLVMDNLGNLYGSTYRGGAKKKCGTVFELTPAGTETVLHNFTGKPGDGAVPFAGLVMDTLGNLYGSTIDGGAKNKGTVFELTPTGTETVLHSFTGKPGDGAVPNSRLVMDNLGNLYGTTADGGAKNFGTVFELTPAGTETVLYSFTGKNGDGAYPLGGVVMDNQGNFYGITGFGGAKNFGTVFKLTPAGTETVLYSFTSSNGDGAYPDGGLVMDSLGNLYGTTVGGGTDGWGTVFELTPAGTETVLYSFTSSNGDGAVPNGGLIMDNLGNLYGTTYYGGVDFGIVFEVTP